MTDQSEAISVYLRFREVFGSRPSRPGRDERRRVERRADSSSEPFGSGSGRDPRELGAVMDSLTGELGWAPFLAQSDAIGSWAEIVGEDTAAHTCPEGVSDGVLVVRCESSAWATSLRLMGGRLLGELRARFVDAGIESIRFLGPDAPSWKRGSRTIPGRGPRDTYG